eukprot:Rhum_TRINITY_DN16950_c0_g1::Rhum_TRINITY_DN16950_c0_g1_i1::g.164867::m.164867/K13513/LCLAT1, AGPAT8; lysocardiolipin and lysophospholipid acyltransferase
MVVPDAARGAAVLLALLVSAYLGSVLMIPLALPFFLVPVEGVRRLALGWIDCVKLQWLTLTVILLSHIGGTSFHTYGDLPSGSDSVLVLSNHRTRIDWMMLWGVFAACRNSALLHLRIMLRRDLTKLPFFGWAMSAFRFIFVSRNWSTDKSYLKEYCDYFIQHEGSAWFLVFPEGTDLSKSNQEKARIYAESSGHPVLSEVLYPKVTGTHFLLDHLRSRLDCVCDLTMGYRDHTGRERTSEKSLMHGKFPREVHVLVKTIPIRDFPTTSDKVGEYLRTSFIAKDEEIKKFYERDCSFGENGRKLSLSVSQYATCAAYWFGAFLLQCVLYRSWIGLGYLALVIAMNARFGPGLDHFITSTASQEKAKRNKKNE